MKKSNLIWGIDFANGKDKTIINGEEQ